MSAEKSVSQSESDPEVHSVVGRRHLLRGGAVLAGAAGAAALTAVAVQPAHAADGQPVLQGRTSPENDATSTTGLRIGGTAGDTDSPTLLLRNANGPSLELEALDSTFAGDLAIGQIANTEIGPTIGVLDPTGTGTTSFLATEFDLDAIPRPVALSPDRLVDTRPTSPIRGYIINTPASHFDAGGRLLARKWLNLRVADVSPEGNITAAFVNTVSVGSLDGGYMTLYPPPASARPTASSINYSKGQTIANGGLVALSTLNDAYAFTIYTSATTHVIVDLTGLILSLDPGPGANARRRAPGARRTRAASRVPKLVTKRR